MEEIRFGLIAGGIMAAFIALWNFYLEPKIKRWLGVEITYKDGEIHSIFIDPRKNKNL